LIAFCATLHQKYKLKGFREKWLLREVATKVLPSRIAARPKTMFRAKRAKTFLGTGRPAWVDQLLSPESLRATGYFEPEAVARIRHEQATQPMITIKRSFFDLALTGTIATQLWHHIYCGGGLADLPTSSPPEISAEHLSAAAHATEEGEPA
jgi:asparagine synthase (glutamine-hydrolysing)